MAETDEKRARLTPTQRKALEVLGAGPAMIALLSSVDALKPYGDILTRIVLGYEQVSAAIWGWVDLRLPFELPFSHGALSLLVLLALPLLRGVMLRLKPPKHTPELMLLNFLCGFALVFAFDAESLRVLFLLLGFFALLVAGVMLAGLGFGPSRWTPRASRMFNHVLWLALAALVIGHFAASDAPADAALAIVTGALCVALFVRGDLALSYIVCGAAGIWALDFAAKRAPGILDALDGAGI